MRGATIIACLVAFLAGPSSRAAAQERVAFSDQAVAEAIKKGVEYLWSRQKGDGSWPPFGEGKGKDGKESQTYNPAGPSALAVYALLEADVSPQDPRMIKALSWLAAQKSDRTYTLGIRCNVWTAANAKTRGKYRKNLEDDANQLIASTKSGSYNYYCKADGKSEGDNSNSQYGLLGVWGAHRGGVEVPREYWDKVIKHWIVSQTTDGGWSYSKERPEARNTMVAAGVASMYVCFDNLYQKEFLTCGINTDEFPPYKCIKKGLDWFDKNFTRTLDQGDVYYYLYGVERVGLACGFKYFGQADWYKLGATKLLQSQQANGSWTGGHGPDVSTPFSLLFLIRGRHPILFNKLEREGDWNNRPRDMATLTRWISKTLEATVNWQVINLKVPVREWHDAPILYIAGSQAPRFSDEDIGKLRTFVWQGGTILSCTEGNGAFGREKGMREVYKKMFPKYELALVPPDHPMYKDKGFYPLEGRAKFYMVSNGIRPLAIHADEDLPVHWQRGDEVTHRWAFEAAENIRKFVTDKERLLYRGVSLWPEESKETTSRTIKLARLQHPGDFDPEPLAYERFTILMAKQAKVKLEVLGPMPIADLAGSGAQVAALTGTGPLKLTDEEKDALKKWVAAGGTLVIDAAGGSKAFAESAEQLLVAAYGPESLRLLEMNSPIYTLPGMAVTQVGYRRQAKEELGNKKQPGLLGIEVNNRPAIIYSAQDLTAGLVGCPAYTCVGYDRDSAFALMRNIVVFAGGGPAQVKAAEASPSAQPTDSPKKEPAQAAPKPKPAPKKV